MLYNHNKVKRLSADIDEITSIINNLSSNRQFKNNKPSAGFLDQDQIEIHDRETLNGLIHHFTSLYFNLKEQLKQEIDKT